MTTWRWAQLPTGMYGLPGPAVVTSSWVLEVREHQPELAGFTLITAPGQWAQAATAPQVIADYPEPEDLMVIAADQPLDVDAHALRYLLPGAREPGGVRWVTGSMFHGPDADTFHDQVHQAGRVLLLTGDLHARWAAAQAGRTPSFDELFPGGTWAAWLPLLPHLYPDGVGTRPMAART